MPTPELARNLLEYGAAGRRQVALMRTVPMAWLNELMALCGGLAIWQGVRWDERVSIVLGMLMASYPLGISAFLPYMERRLARAEQANADLTERPDLYVVEPDCIDMITN